MTKIVLISGATAGIGWETALRFAKEGYDVIATGRRAERLEELQKKIEKSGQKLLPLCFDISDRKAVESAVASIPKEWQEIDVLVNNAGLALGVNLIQDGNPEEWDTMIDTNVKGLLYLSHEIMPILVKRGKGHIINLCSIASKEVYRTGNIYNATKFAVDALTKAMRIDLLESSIRVTGIYPGLVETEFSIVRFHGDTKKAHERYLDFTPLTGTDVADAIFYVASRPGHVNINELVIMPTAQANTTHLYKK